MSKDIIITAVAIYFVAAIALMSDYVTFYHNKGRELGVPTIMLYLALMVAVLFWPVVFIRMSYYNYNKKVKGKDK